MNYKKIIICVSAIGLAATTYGVSVFENESSIKTSAASCAEYNNLNFSDESNTNKQNNTYALPEFDTSFKSYMDYRTITDVSSEQYKIQSKAWTDEDGFRRLNDDYIVAVGTYYSDKCGKRFKVRFDSGNEITVVAGDIKQNCHTDITHKYTPVYNSNGDFISANVLEFVVDTGILSKKSKLLGSVNCYEYLNGNIISIEAIDNGT